MQFARRRLELGPGGPSADTRRMLQTDTAVDVDLITASVSSANAVTTFVSGATTADLDTVRLL